MACLFRMRSTAYGSYGEAIVAKITFDPNVFTEVELKTLQDVVAKFAAWSTKQLVMASHEEKVWRENKPGHGLISYQKYAFELQAIQ